eukprot:9768220-Alexandrium_andersonii.AAC.1
MVSIRSRPSALRSIKTPISLFALDAVVQLQDPTTAAWSATTTFAWDIATPLQVRPTALYSTA